METNPFCTDAPLGLAQFHNTCVSGLNGKLMPERQFQKRDILVNPGVPQGGN